MMILADKRYQRTDKRSKMPAWITTHLKDATLNLSTLRPPCGPFVAFPSHTTGSSSHPIRFRTTDILENLHLPDTLPPRGATAFVSPLNVQGAPEAPARVWAVVS